MPTPEPVRQKYLKCEVAGCDAAVVSRDERDFGSHIIYVGRCARHADVSDSVAIDQARWMIMGR